METKMETPRKSEMADTNELDELAQYAQDHLLVEIPSINVRPTYQDVGRKFSTSITFGGFYEAPPTEYYKRQDQDEAIRKRIKVIPFNTEF